MTKVLKLKPTFKDYIWGGDRLRTQFGKQSDLSRIAESWELSCHKDGLSTISGGEYDGRSLAEYLSEYPEALGTKIPDGEMPVLIKLIDAKDNLSIQVHPDDSYAQRVEGQQGKTEMWYIVDCGKEAFLYYGVSNEVTSEEFKEHIKNNTILDILNKVPVKPGDVFFIPSGTIHAICSDILICEVQQNSNVTYRVYDYDRKGADGKTRELHIDKAAEVADLYPSVPQGNLEGNILAKCDYFTVEKIKCFDKLIIQLADDSFRSLIILSGEGTIELDGCITRFSKGDSVFVPAQNAEAVLRGSFEAILSYV